MTTVYLADDEPLILSGLTKILQSFRMDLEIVGTSEDGQKALNDVLSLQPDILICDIQMPGKTGLEIITQITEQKLTTRIIFLTGYRDFSYIKHAIDHEAVEYLLKPVDERELKKAVMKSIRFLADRQKLAYFERPAEERDMPLVTRSASGEILLSEPALRRQLASMHHESGTPMVCVLFSLPEYAREENGLSYEHFELLRFTAVHLIRTKCSSEIESLMLLQENTQLVYLFFTDRENREFLEGILSGIRREILDKYGLEVRIGASETVCSAAEAGYALKTARYALSQYFFTEESLSFSADIHQTFLYSFEDYNKAFEGLLESLLHHEGVQLQAEKMEDTLNIIRSLHYSNPQAVINRTLMMMASLRSEAERYGLTLCDEDFYNRMIRRISGAASFRLMKEALLASYRELIENMDSPSEQSDIRKVVYYLEHHYSENITLNQLAGLVYMNPSYFSFYFKKSTGENYKTMLTRIRIEKSIPLLLNTDLKLYAVASKVGYNDVKQYVHAFKKIRQISPVEYREKYAHASERSSE